MSFKKVEIRCCELAKKAPNKSKDNLFCCDGNQITAINSPSTIPFGIASLHELFFHDIKCSDGDAFGVKQQHWLSGNYFYSGEVFK